jgi:hypothetical protein
MNEPAIAILSSTIDKRPRRSKAEMQELRTALFRICKERKPLTARHAFYCLASEGLIAKTEKDYDNVVLRLLGQMREEGLIPFSWVVDHTRWMRKRPSYLSLHDMLERGAELYRRNLWADSEWYVEVWCESESIMGVLYDVTDKWDVPLMPARGYSPKTLCWTAAQSMREEEKPVAVLYFGDYDYDGIRIDKDIEAKLRRYALGVDIMFHRCAITPEQAAQLPSKPPKATKSKRRQAWKGGTVELEAMPPKHLQAICESAIEQFVDREGLKMLKRTEEMERNTLRNMARVFEPACCDEAGD